MNFNEQVQQYINELTIQPQQPVRIGSQGQYGTKPITTQDIQNAITTLTGIPQEQHKTLLTPILTQLKSDPKSMKNLTTVVSQLGFQPVQAPTQQPTANKNVQQNTTTQTAVQPDNQTIDKVKTQVT